MNAKPENSVLLPNPADTQRIEVSVVRSARRRNLAIHVSARGEVEVRAPLQAGTQLIARFLDAHRDWILRKVANARCNPPWQPVWQAGGDWFWRGERIQLVPGGPRGGYLLDGQLALPLRADADAARWQRATFLWHRRVGGELLEARARELFSVHCLPHRLRSVEFKWMRVTWGTCGGKRGADRHRDVVLRLNPLLASLPAVLADAILLHELAHVEHMNHGPAFYRRLEVLDPEWRTHDRELNVWAKTLLPVVRG